MILTKRKTRVWGKLGLGLKEVTIKNLKISKFVIKNLLKHAEIQCI